MFEKIEVNGSATHPLYRFLKEGKRGIFGTKRIKWNFTKFLVDRNGNVVGPLRTQRQSRTNWRIALKPCSRRNEPH